MNKGKGIITVLTVKFDKYFSPYLPVSDSGVSGVRCLFLGVPPKLLINYNL
jgi:hypothetical protein